MYTITVYMNTYGVQMHTLTVQMNTGCTVYNIAVPIDTIVV